MEIVHYPHPALMASAKEIISVDKEELAGKIREMFSLMYENKGVGLAAPQVAWSVRLCIVNPTGEAQDELILINPKVTKFEGEQDGDEGCLSFPGIYAKVKRAQTIEVEYQNERLEKKTITCSDLLARIIQHEVDHLDNVLLIHRMSKAEKFHHRRKLKELKTAFST